MRKSIEDTLMAMGTEDTILRAEDRIIFIEQATNQKVAKQAACPQKQATNKTCNGIAKVQTWHQKGKENIPRSNDNVQPTTGIQLMANM